MDERMRERAGWRAPAGRAGKRAGQHGRRDVAGAWGTFFTIDPAEHLVAILKTQGRSSRIHTRTLFKNLVYGAMVESARSGA
jgi:CubicO group peptidase (beta-lactamase class C family)